MEMGSDRYPFLAVAERFTILCIYRFITKHYDGIWRCFMHLLNITFIHSTSTHILMLKPVKQFSKIMYLAANSSC